MVWNGTVWDPVGVPQDLSDSIFSLVIDADPTKKALFSLSGIAIGTTRTYNLPNTSSELAILAGTQTFTGNKTFSGTLTASGTVTVSAASANIGTATTTATYGKWNGVTDARSYLNGSFAECSNAASPTADRRLWADQVDIAARSARKARRAAARRL